MKTSFKKILVIVAGGHSFSYVPRESSEGFKIPDDEQLREKIENNVAAQLIGSNIQLGIEIIGRDPTGADRTYDDFDNIGLTIMKSYHDYDGFVVLHGDNTIPWAASQLAFGFENLGKPIVFADSKNKEEAASIVSSEQSIITASQLAAYTNIPEVSVLSSTLELIKGVDTIHSSADDSTKFISRNDVPLVRVGRDIVINNRNVNDMPLGETSYTPINSSISIPIYIVNPVSLINLDLYMDEQPNGLIIVVSGGGDMPIEQANIRECLERAQQNFIPVIAVTSCAHGSVSFPNTERGKEIENLGVISGGAMTTPAAVAKLRSLLSRQTPYTEMANAIANNMIGETVSMSKVLTVPNDRKPNLAPN